MNPDQNIIQKFQLDCACGLYVQVQASSLGEAKSKLRTKGCKVVGPPHNQRWACARCAEMEKLYAP